MEGGEGGGGGLNRGLTIKPLRVSKPTAIGRFSQFFTLNSLIVKWSEKSTMKQSERVFGYNNEALVMSSHRKIACLKWDVAPYRVERI